MEIWPCMLNVAKSRNLEAMTVAFLLCLLEAAVILYRQFCSTVSEIILAQAHRFICKTSEIRTGMTGRAVICLEEFISFEFIS